MAKQIITKLTDDLDGGDADESVIFAIDGVEFEIDLSENNAAELREFLSRYQQAGTRLVKNRQGIARQQSGTRHPNFVANKQLNQTIRAWAVDNGYQLSERGRIPQSVVDAYHSGTPAPNATPEPVPAPEVVEERKVPRRARRAPAAKFQKAAV